MSESIYKYILLTLEQALTLYKDVPMWSNVNGPNGFEHEDSAPRWDSDVLERVYNMYPKGFYIRVVDDGDTP